MIVKASAAIGTAPLELLIFAMPLIPTNAYIGPIGGCPPQISRTSWVPATEHETPDELAADDERRARGLVVDTGGLEDDALVGPAHRPVDLPDQLAAAEVPQQDGLGEAVLADVGQLRRVVVVPRDRRGVPAA